MNEMIKRVAEAIANNRITACACLGPLPVCQCQQRQAIAAIKAMREPTEEMFQIGREYDKLAGLDHLIVSKAAYKAMIDAALKDDDNEQSSTKT